MPKAWEVRRRPGPGRTNVSKEEVLGVGPAEALVVDMGDYRLVIHPWAEGLAVSSERVGRRVMDGPPLTLRMTTRGKVVLSASFSAD